VTGDHHSEYLARALAALTPEGHARVDELLEELAAAGHDRVALVRFAKVRRVEADLGREDPAEAGLPILSAEELQGLRVGFRTIRDTEQLDDVADWANAVLALLADEG
jgi:hypothetical protein